MPITWSTSDRSENENRCLSANRLFVAGSSKEAPSTTAPKSVNDELRSRKPWPSTVQPSESALGNHHSTIQELEKLVSEITLPY